LKNAQSPTRGPIKKKRVYSQHSTYKYLTNTQVYERLLSVTTKRYTFEIILT